MGFREDPLFLTIIEEIERHGVDLSDEEAFAKAFEAALRAPTLAAAEVLAEALQRATPSMLCNHASIQAGFEARLRARWAEPFDRLRTTVVGCYEIGRDLNADEQGSISPDDFEFEALRRIHGRACQTAWEVICLIESGFANGAQARWRTVHELAVVSIFILDHGPTVAERYLLHKAINSLGALKTFDAHHSALGFEKPNTQDRRAIQARVDALIDRFGEPFAHQYGWAADALGSKRPTFADIEASIDFDHLRPFFKLACQGVHAGPEGLYFNIGIPPGTPDLILGGATNTGFTDPASLCAQSLIAVTGALVAARPSVERLVAMHAVSALADDVAGSFLRVQKEVESLPEGRRDLRFFRHAITAKLRESFCRIRRKIYGR